MNSSYKFIWLWWNWDRTFAVWVVNNNSLLIKEYSKTPTLTWFRLDEALQEYRIENIEIKWDDIEIEKLCKWVIDLWDFS